MPVRETRPAHGALRCAFYLLALFTAVGLAWAHGSSSNDGLWAQTLPPTPTEEGNTLPSPTSTPIVATPSPPVMPTLAPTSIPTRFPDLTPTSTPIPTVAPLAIEVSDRDIAPGDTVVLLFNRAELPAGSTQLVVVLPPPTRYTETGSTPGWRCRVATDDMLFCVFDLASVQVAATSSQTIAFVFDIAPTFFSLEAVDVKIDLLAQGAEGRTLAGQQITVTIQPNGLTLFLPLVTRTQ